MLLAVILYWMIDKRKYASHGAFIKRLPEFALAQRQKPKLAVIHPLPSSVPRLPEQDHQLHDTVLQSKTFSTKFRFQSNVDRKPIAEELVQPFLYIEKVIQKKKPLRKKKREQKSGEGRESKNDKDRSESKTKKERGPLYPKQLEEKNKEGSAYVSSRVKERQEKRAKKQTGHRAPSAKVLQQAPPGFKNLYDYEQQRRKAAEKLFKKLFQSEVPDLKDMFLLWSGKAKKMTPDIEVKEKQFVEFIKEILPGKIAQKQVRQFFELYMDKPPRGREKDDQFRLISIRSLSFNYNKYVKKQMEVSNILSEKVLKQRYIWVKSYLSQFDTNYHALKQAMNSIKSYQQSLKCHFSQLFSSYKNPYADQIDSLRRQLQKPIVKYDKLKKNELNKRIEELTLKSEEQSRKLTEDYERFCGNYEASILTNHDLFFTKRTICKLVLPILNQHPTLTRKMLEEQVGVEQEKKERYLECLSELVVEMDRDKKHLSEDCFTLDEVVQLVLMRSKKSSGDDKFSADFLLYSSKKLIKQIKKQFLLKYQLSVENMDEFPADQEISLDLLHTCFEMECTKVLLKNQIWTELLNFIPEESQQKSKLHQLTIDGNICLELLKRYLAKLDERMRIELSKSKHISLVAENVNLDQFEMMATVFEGVMNRMNDYVQDDEEEMIDRVQPLQEKRKVTFADIVDKAVDRSNFPEKAKEQDRQRQLQNNIIKSLIKSIFEGQQAKPESAKAIPNGPASSQFLPTESKGPMVENMVDMKTLAKSFYVPEGLNTNSFDIRYFQKEKAKAEEGMEPLEPQVVRMGSSILLSNLPKVEQINSLDPLKISRLLMSNIDKGLKQEKKVIKEQMLQSNIKEGVNNNYFKEKIKLENKPTVYDSQGRSKYSVLLPVGYYQDFVAAENIPENQKWYLRPHHVETLTENPLSKKDNIIHTEYQSKLDKLPPKKRPDQHNIEQNVKRKAQLIDSLEDRINSLKRDLQGAQRGSRAEGAKVHPAVVDNYLSKLIQEKEDKDLQIASYQGVLYDLRRKQRELLNVYRNQQSAVVGDPGQKWWQRKDNLFNIELRKQRLLVTQSLNGSSKHREYVDKLKNSQIY